MPDITVHNQTSSPLNVAFCVTTPLAFSNDVQPDQTIRLHLASFVHTFEARVDSGDNRYSPGESWQKVGEIGTACAAGVAAVALGTGWFLGTFAGPVRPVALGWAGAAWNTAHASWVVFILLSILTYDFSA